MNTLPLSPLEFILMAFIYRKQGLSGRGLARMYMQQFGDILSYGSLYTTLRRLRKHDYVLEAKNDRVTDRRLSTFTLTLSGANKVREMKDGLLKLVVLVE